MSSLRTSFIGIVVITIAGLIYTFAAGNEPLLGLDLQGGVSVVLQPTEEASGEELDQSIEIMRRRVDAIGVAEPEITRQGDTILVQLPGVDDQQRALELVGQTAELRFRPVLGCVADGAEPLTSPEQQDPEATVILPGRDGETGCDGVALPHYRLGPSLLTGDTLSGASATQQGLTWVVNPVFHPGADGIDQFNSAAARCHVGAPDPLVCPTGRLSIVLDGTVVIAPSIELPSFGRDGIAISGGFDQEEAQDVALVLRFGALPIELETQQVQTVSATLGRDSLQAGIVAGLVGLALVALYMCWYYRLLGVVAVLSLAVSFGLLWTIISWLGEAQGLALTLAGVTGLVVSIGVSVDSNVVYFEDLKEDVGSGRPLFSAVDLSFGRAFSTIVKADVASLIGALVLYVLTVGPVKGFALYLGLATVLDLVASYFFMRPAVMLLGRSGLAERKPSMVGVPPVGSLIDDRTATVEADDEGEAAGPAENAGAVDEGASS
ncbi:MAG: protein translocase subunit SecD [Actinomycetia bacterium]|nr:protein translocase subunit SecD [Actinomycetes bacterium]